MKNVIKEFERSVSEYEKKFQNDFLDIKNNIDFHFDTLKETIQATDELLDFLGDEISEMCDAIQELYEVDDANTHLKKLELKVLKWICNKKYSNYLDEIVEVQNIKERLQKLLKRLEIVRVFR